MIEDFHVINGNKIWLIQHSYLVGGPWLWLDILLHFLIKMIMFSEEKKSTILCHDS
jgi:hypothetical protein